MINLPPGLRTRTASSKALYRPSRVGILWMARLERTRSKELSAKGSWRMAAVYSSILSATPSRSAFFWVAERAFLIDHWFSRCRRQWPCPGGVRRQPSRAPHHGQYPGRGSAHPHGDPGGEKLSPDLEFDAACG